MPERVRMILEGGEVAATIDDSPTGEAVRAALPLEGIVSRWGEEIYFSIPVKVEEAPDARQDMAVGEIAFWPVGSAFCIFWGPTPASSGPLPRAYSNVNLFGKIDGPMDAAEALLSRTEDGQKIRVESVTKAGD
jgi:uncharacterized protein